MFLGYPDGTSGKDPTANAGQIREMVQSLGQEDPLEEGMATHPSILAWRTTWTKELKELIPWGCKNLNSTEGTWQACTSSASILLF